MEVIPGYRLTEIGVIPEDWEVIRLGDLASVTSGGTPSRANPKYWNGDIPWVTTSEVDFYQINHAKQFITQEGMANSAANLLPIGTILMALYGQGKTRGKIGILGIEAATNQACAAISLKEEVDHEFIFHFLTSRYDAIRNLSNTGNQENLNSSLVRSIPILLPSPSEQRAIATALRDVDALLSGLDQLITKKRDLYTGAMQRLLTGETRLPGFTAPWQVKRLGDHVSFLRNGVHSRAQLTVDGPIFYLHYGDIHVASSICLDLSKAMMPRLPTAAATRLTRLEDGDIVFVDASEDLAGVGKSLEIEGAKGIEAVAGQHTIATRFDKALLADGFKKYLQFIPSFIVHLRRLAAGTKVYATNRKHIASAEIALPKPDEQSAIAQVLSDMEAEIRALETQLEKTRDLKQAMMQALLTGRVRLLLPAVEACEKEVAYA